MTGITYGQWRSQMAAQVADEARQEYYANQNLREENAKLKAELLALKLVLDKNKSGQDHYRINL